MDQFLTISSHVLIISSSYITYHYHYIATYIAIAMYIYMGKPLIDGYTDICAVTHTLMGKARVSHDICLGKILAWDRIATNFLVFMCSSIS